MKKITRIITLIVLSYNLNAQQELFVLHPTYTEQVINDHNFEPIVYEAMVSNLTKDNMENEKMEEIGKDINFVLGTTINYKELQGQFKKIGDFVIIKEDYKSFLKNEIIKKDTFLKSGISTNRITLHNYTDIILDVLKKKYYLVTYDFLATFSFGIVKSTLQNTTERGLKSSMSLTKENSLQYAIEQYKSMILRCKELNTKLLVHGLLAQKGLMSRKRMKIWQGDITEAKLLSIRIDEFINRYTKEQYEFQDYMNHELLEDYENFTNTLSSVQLSGF